MFYGSEILTRRRGQFAIIWLAATRGRKLTRRDFSSVNIVKTCDDIIDYLFATSGRKRLSLYLSSQLTYGVLLIYKKQQDILLDDCSNLMTRFHKSIAKEINLKLITRKEQVTKPSFSMDEIKLGYEDTTNLVEIPDVDVWICPIAREEARLSPMHSTTISGKLMPSLPASPTIVDLEKFKPEYSPHTAERNQITLKETFEKSIETSIQQQQEPELPEMLAQDFQMIAEQPVEPDLLQLPKTPVKRGRSPPREAAQETPKDALPDQVTPGAPDRHKRTTVDPDLTQEKIEAPPRKRPRIPAMVLSPVISASGRPRRRRLMVDLETSLSRDSIRRNLVHTSDIVRNIMENRLSHDILFKSSVKELFKHPLKKEFKHKSLLPMWKRNLKAVTEFGETESEKKHPIFSVPELRLSSTSGSSVSGSEKTQERARRGQGTPPAEETLPAETVRVGESFGSDRAITPVSAILRKSAGSISLEGSRSKTKKRRTDSRSLTHSLTHSLSEEELTQIASADDTLARRLEDELYPLPEEVPMDLSAVTLSPVKHIAEMIPISEFSIIHLLEAVEKQTLDQEWTTFKEICPPLHTPRNRAAVIFHKLLDAHKERYINIRQDEPYGDILIRLR